MRTSATMKPVKGTITINRAMEPTITKKVRQFRAALKDKHPRLGEPFLADDRNRMARDTITRAPLNHRGNIPGPGT